MFIMGNFGSRLGLPRAASGSLKWALGGFEITNDAKIIKLVDKTSNMRAITFSPAPNWSVKCRLEYIGWAREVVNGLRGASPWLEQQLDHAAAEAEGSVAVRSAKL